MEIQSARMLAQTLTSQLSKSAPSADEAQAARFKSMLQQPSAPADAVVSGGHGMSSPAAALGHANATVGESAIAEVATTPSSLGDNILHGIAKIRGSLNEGLAEVDQMVDPEKGPMSTAKLLQFQVGMLNMGFQYQMVAGVVTKTAQNIDQLVKMQ